MSEQIPKIVITMEGGVIQNIDSDLPVKILVLDMNPDEGDYFNKDTFTNLEGDKQEAVVQVWTGTDTSAPIAEHIFNQMEKRYEL